MFQSPPIIFNLIKGFPPIVFDLIVIQMFSWWLPEDTCSLFLLSKRISRSVVDIE